MTVNVCGLKSKLCNRVFLEECCKHTILCFTETLTDDMDIDFITSVFADLGFDAFINNRFKISSRRSGGIVVAVSKKLGSVAMPRKSNSNTVQWIKLKKEDITRRKICYWVRCTSHLEALPIAV